MVVDLLGRELLPSRFLLVEDRTVHKGPNTPQALGVGLAKGLPFCVGILSEARFSFRLRVTRALLMLSPRRWSPR